MRTSYVGTLVMNHCNCTLSGLDSVCGFTGRRKKHAFSCLHTAGSCKASLILCDVLHNKKMRGNT